MVNKLSFKYETINNVDDLARILCVSLIDLKEIVKNAYQFYRPNKRIKNRLTYTVLSPLKEIQASILERILRNVDFPEFIQGGIRTTSLERGPITDAKKHVNQYIIIHIDIRKYFPSIRYNPVFQMWKNFFNFPYEVAEMLTKLTTYKGFVPQGAKTSSYISNIIFWEKEPYLEQEFREEGLIYSRYIDDIQVSSKKRLGKKEEKQIYDKIFNMLGHYHLRPSYKKCKLQTKSKRMGVHNININSGKPSLPQETRGRIRAAVHELETYVQGDITVPEYIKMLQSVEGRIAWLTQLHPHDAELLNARVDKAKKVFERRALESLLQGL